MQIIAINWRVNVQTIYFFLFYILQERQQSIEQGSMITEIWDVGHTFGVHVTQEDVIDVRTT
jgi:hypothetical protein